MVTKSYGKDATALATGMLELMRSTVTTEDGGMTAEDLQRCPGPAGRLSVIQLLCLAYYASCEGNPNEARRCSASSPGRGAHMGRCHAALD